MSEQHAGRTLDWYGRFDPASLPFRIAETDCFQRGIPHRDCDWTRGLWLDQGSEGACTGFGTAHALSTTPRRVQNITETIARELYYEARRRDQWEGEDYEGSSVLGAMKAAKDLGYIKSYRWCLTLDEMKHAISWHGPLVIGVPWYSGMWDTDADGYLHVSGSVVGGHALCVAGYHPRTQTFRLDNSWGSGWGRNGSALLSEADMDRLRSEWGEFALPCK